jgi:large subunit ribosomal protein L35
MEQKMSGRTHKGLKKRLKRTAGGRIRRRSSGKRHLMSHKPADRARRLRGWTDLSDADRKSLEKQFGKIQ